MSTTTAPVVSKTSTLVEETELIENIKTIFNPQTCIKRGLCAVSLDKKRSPEPHNLYYELHGSIKPDSTKMLLIMGMNNSSFAWKNQVEYFSQEEMNCTILVFDNRGVGNSDSPISAGKFYKTSEMAKDTIELLEFIGWKGERELNIVGISMGGMIALELAKVIPERILSLILTSTKAGGKLFDLPSLRKVYIIARLSSGFVQENDIVRLTLELLFPNSYCDEIDPKTGLARRITLEEDFKSRIAIGKVQTKEGKLGQLAAVLKHNVSDSQLLEISKKVPTIAIITGDEDMLISHSNSIHLHDKMPGSELKIVPKAGHALPSQISEEYNLWVARVISDAQKAQKAHVSASESS